MLAWPIAVKEKHMKKKAEKANDELREDYEPALICNGVRGKYAKRYKAGVKLVMLAPDVAAAFPDAKAVNDALRLLLQVAKTTVPTAAGAR